MLPTAGCNVGTHCGCGIAADRTDAGPVGPTGADGNSSRGVEQFHANEKQAEIMRRASHGDFRLLYLSPERLARADTISWLQSVPVAFFAIDEAHCISEWGHEFRPEYRQLSRLRAHFPDRPIAAFTASATKRVRHDILHQLQLRDPHKYIASFHRSNLRYLVKNVRAASSPACCSAPCATIRAAASSCTRRRSPK